MAGTGGGCGCPGCRAKTGGCSPKTMIQIWKKYSEYSGDPNTGWMCSDFEWLNSLVVK